MSFLSSNAFSSFKFMNHSGGTGIFVYLWLVLHGLLFYRKDVDVTGKCMAREINSDREMKYFKTSHC